MADAVSRQLTDIHAMLSSGHRSLRIERHTLVLWGLAGAGLLAVSDRIFLPEQMPAQETRALAWLLLLAGTLGTVAVADWRLTRRVKRERDEAMSFVHRQILKVWWLLMAMGVIVTFATFFFGGGYMVCAAWVVLAGLGLFVHGLFSEDLLEWVGVLAILTGIASLAYQLDFSTTRWIAASVFGVGLPLLGAMLGRPQPATVRMGQASVWLLAVLAGPLLLHTVASADSGDAVPTISLAAFRQQADVSGRRIVEIPAGTSVPITIDLTGSLFRPTSSLVLPVTLAEPVQLAMIDGLPEGPWRRPGHRWMPAASALWIKIPHIKADLSPAIGPAVQAQLNLSEFR